MTVRLRELAEWMRGINGHCADVLTEILDAEGGGVVSDATWQDPTGFSVTGILDEANNWTRRETGKQMLLNYAAALEHFTEGSHTDAEDAARYRWLRKRVGVSASYGFTNAYIPCGNSKITEADAAFTDQIIDAAIKGERHE